MSKSIVVKPGDFSVLFRGKRYYRHQIPIAFRPLCKLEQSKEPGFRFVGAKTSPFGSDHPNNTDGWIAQIPQVTSRAANFPKLVGYNDELTIRDLQLIIENGTLVVKGKGELALNPHPGFPVALFFGVNQWGNLPGGSAFLKPDEERGEYNTGVDGDGHFEFLAKILLDVRKRTEHFLHLNVHQYTEIIGDGDEWGFGLPLPSKAFQDFCGSLNASFIKYPKAVAKKGRV